MQVEETRLYESEIADISFNSGKNVIEIMDNEHVIVNILCNPEIIPGNICCQTTWIRKPNHVSKV